MTRSSRPCSGLASKKGDAECGRRAHLLGYFRQHGDASGNVEPADADRQAGMQKRLRQIDSPGELVRLHADQAEHAAATCPPDHPDVPIGSDTLVGLVVGVDADRYIGPEHLPPAGVYSETVEAGQRVRRYRRLDPLDRIAVVGVMRRLDQHQMKDRHIALKQRRRREAGQVACFELSPGRTIGAAKFAPLMKL